MAWIFATSFDASGSVALGTVEGTIVDEADGTSGGSVISIGCSQLALLFLASRWQSSHFYWISSKFIRYCCMNLCSAVYKAWS